jgi:electron-transferring-flavoprotein dehydrogenase
MIKVASKLRSIANKPSHLRNIQRMFSAEELEQIPYDVCIVGGGIAGLSTAIKIKQLCKENEIDLSVCVLEKGSEIGSHILSGNVFQPTYLSELFPDWQKMDNPPPLYQPVLNERFEILMQNKFIDRLSVPNFLLPGDVHNKGNYVISLGSLCRWMSQQATDLGVDIFTGFAVNDFVMDESGKKLNGVVTKEFGIAKNGERKENYQPGVHIAAPMTVVAEGARGSLTGKISKKFNLQSNGSDVQTYGIGIKEVWEVKDHVDPGFVLHTVGFPASSRAYAGGFLYTTIDEVDSGKLKMGEIDSSKSASNLPSAKYIHLGYVVGLDYKNPYINPYEEFQLWKSHPSIRTFLEKSQVIKYGARVINEGGYYAIPRLTFPGGLLVGCSAGFLNVMKIKGAHNAMKSGIEAAHSIVSKAKASDLNSTEELTSYGDRMKKSPVFSELFKTRNFKGGFKFGTLAGLANGGLISLLGGKEPWSLRNGNHKDALSVEPAEKHQKIDYPKHDGKITFDILESVMRSGTHHDHDQKSHLSVKKELATAPYESLTRFAGYEGRLTRTLLSNQSLRIRRRRIRREETGD